jgi:hypothetical protein
LALNELLFERCQVHVIELKLQLESPIRQAAPLAQKRNRLIHHLMLSLSAHAQTHHSIGDRERAEKKYKRGKRG